MFKEKKKKDRSSEKWRHLVYEISVDNAMNWGFSINQLFLFITDFYLVQYELLPVYPPSGSRILSY